MSQTINGGIDEPMSHGSIYHGVIHNAFNGIHPSPPPPEDYYYWVDDDGKYFFSDDDKFFISTEVM